MSGYFSYTKYRFAPPVLDIALTESLRKTTVEELDSQLRRWRKTEWIEFRRGWRQVSIWVGGVLGILIGLQHVRAMVDYAEAGLLTFIPILLFCLGSVAWSSASFWDFQNTRDKWFKKTKANIDQTALPPKKS